MGDRLHAMLGRLGSSQHTGSDDGETQGCSLPLKPPVDMYPRGGRGDPIWAGEGVINELIKGFSKLAAATEKAPHPDRSDAHPARPLSLTACSVRLWGLRWHWGPLLAAAVASREPGRAVRGGITRLAFGPFVFQVRRSCACRSCCQRFLHNKSFCFI